MANFTASIVWTDSGEILNFQNKAEEAKGKQGKM